MPNWDFKCKKCDWQTRVEYKQSNFEIPQAIAYLKGVLECRKHYVKEHPAENPLSDSSVIKVICKRIGYAAGFDLLVILLAAIFLPIKVICFPFWWVYEQF